MANLLPLDHLPEVLLPVLYGCYDVPEILVFARVNRRFFDLITGNVGFIRGYNARVDPPVWLFNHSVTPDYDTYGVLYGHSMSDGTWLSIAIRPTLNRCVEFELMDFLDLSGSLSLYRLMPINTLLVVNLFGHRDFLVDVPGLMFPPNWLEIPHHISLTSDPQNDTFSILYVMLVGNIPKVHVFESDVGNWTVRDTYLTLEGGWEVSGSGGVLTSEFSLEHNNLLYSIGFRGGRLYYSVRNVMHVNTDEEKWYYFGEWALLLTSSNLGVMRQVRDLVLYHQTTILDPFVRVCPVPGLQHVRISQNLVDKLSAKVFDGVLYIQMQVFEHRQHPYPHDDYLMNYVSRYNIEQLQWLDLIRLPFSPFDDYDEGLNHPFPKFTSRLTLPFP